MPAGASRRDRWRPTDIIVYARSRELADRITLHQCEKNKIGLSEEVDFVLAFYMVHEVPNQEELFAELETILKPDGRALVVEPPLHVSKTAFEETVKIAGAAGLAVVERPRVFLSKAALMRKGSL